MYRRPLWGVGSRSISLRGTIPYGIVEADSTSMMTINSPFVTIGTATGATRAYRLFCVYTLFGETSYSTFKIRCYLNGGATVDFTIQSNATVYYQDEYSNEQAVSNSNDGYFVVRANPSLFSASAPFNIEIDYLELQALDNY